ncbi:CAP-Gly domain-containing linker protein 4 [Chelonia mydas]|uniref:CAP-Gly domain-containing linker protein 4 n=2 Tax=Amniota TaxID=32524 RepID=M7AHP9_CHEMY|nr:CAP-Gly domain-containing linker protein 4 [Chelonia mydas]
MTIEDLPEPSQEGDSLIERYQFLFPGSETSVTFSVAAAPMPSDCEFSFFDPNDAACQEILFNPKTSVSELFAILRQWVPQVQQNIDIIGNEIIKRGCSVNDRDGLTDMTLLHYTCKSGAHGIGDVETAAKFASHLIDLGADTSLRSRWTNMNALHYAAYFDVPELIRVILKNAKPKDVDATCSDFDFGTALHIAAFNLCTAAVKCLLEHGANPAFRAWSALIASFQATIPPRIRRSTVWSNGEVLDLISVSGEEAVQSQLCSSHRNYDIFGHLSRAMMERGHDRDVVQCRVKVKELRNAYRKAHEANGCSGAAPATCHFYKELDVILGGDPTSTPTTTMDTSEPSTARGEEEDEGNASATLRSQPLVLSLADRLRALRKRSRKSKEDMLQEVMQQSVEENRKAQKWRESERRIRQKNEDCQQQNANDKGQIPADVVPDPVDMPLEMADAAASAKEIKQMLLDAVPLSCDISKAMLPNYDHVTGKAMLMSLGLKLGDRVVIAGQKVGTLRFCGTTEFASGQWAGVELDEPEGKNDGSVGKVQYFKCAPRCGIFAPLSKISKASDHKKNFVRSPSTRSTLVKSKKIDVTHITSKVNTGLATLKKDSSAESTFLATEEGMKTMPGKEGLNNASPSTRKNPFDEGEIQLGDKVLVVGQRTGTVRFYGTTKFAPGFWCGIELNKPQGKNDGSVGGVQYFSCLPRYGIFAPPTRVQRLTGSLDSLTEVSSGKMNHPFPGFRRSLSTTSASSQKEINRKNSFVKSRSSLLRRSWSNTTTTNTEGSVKLHEGSQVLLTSSNEMGTIRYIGPADFAPGIWLGLELRSAKGKNDGSVGDKRYFTCKTNHGVLVRPSRVTYRGINGAKLVDDIC